MSEEEKKAIERIIEPVKVMMSCMKNLGQNQEDISAQALNDIADATFPISEEEYGGVLYKHVHEADRIIEEAKKRKAKRAMESPRRSSVAASRSGTTW